MRELRQTCTDKMDISQTRFQRLTIFAKIYVLCAGLDSEYISFPLSFKIYDVACFFLLWYKSIHRRCSVRKSVLRKTSVSESPFLTKLQTLACSFIKNETLTQMFSCKFCVTFKNRFFTEHLWWLPLFDGFINPVISGMKRFVNSFIFDTCFNFVYLFICFLFVFCLFLFFFFLVTASQKFALLLKNGLSLVIPKNFVFSVTITIFAWLAVTIGFAGEELFYKLVIFIKPKKSTNKATAAESFFREGFKWRSPITSAAKGCNFQRHIQNYVKHLRWSVLWRSCAV